MIRKTAGGYVLYSKRTYKRGRKRYRKRLGGPYATRDEAKERERQINYFKHQ